jgi:hypothetical protein
MAEATENGTVRQVQTTDGLFDIEAPKLVKENEYEVNGIHVKTSSGSAIIKFNENEQKTAGGRIEFNSKGNIAVESLTKNVNIEAKKNIQLKPTEEIVVDTGRRETESGKNEAVLKVKNDDTKEWGSFKLKSRTIDLRCHDHGGIALQPCGVDDNNKENKIKFESDRKVSANTSANPATDYTGEGGTGVEFGTFNNEHSSLFTKDYRFNKDGIVYAVTRQTPTTIGDKIDYPTQSDDFKDVIDPDLGVSWETLIKTAKVFEALSEVSNPSASDLITAFNAVFHPQTQQ